MDHLIDTAILLRLANSADPFCLVAETALRTLHRRGVRLCITAQVLIEFRSAATRPAAVNGLGLLAGAVEQLVTDYEAAFTLLEETAAIFPAWKALVRAANVIGKQVHDARLVAVCHVHGVGHLLTFNTAHFARFTGVGPGLTVVHPSQV